MLSSLPRRPTVALQIGPIAALLGLLLCVRKLIYPTIRIKCGPEGGQPPRSTFAGT